MLRRLVLALCGLACLLAPLDARASSAPKTSVPAAEIPLRGPYRYDRGWYHKVQLGDTLPVLANRFGVELRYLASVNRIKHDANLVLGSYLYIPPHSGYYHRAKAGDTLASVAARFHLDVDYLAATNHMTRASALKSGEVLIIPTRTRPASVPESPKTTTVSPSSTRKSSVASPSSKSYTPATKSTTSPNTKRYSSSPSTSSAAPKSSSIAGMSGARTQRLSVPVPASSKPASSSSGADLSDSAPSKPSSSKSSTGAGVSVSSGGKSLRRSSDGRPQFEWPLEGTITRRYVNNEKDKHRGVDIAAPKGTPIRAAADGTVIYSGDDIPGYGKMVIVDHGRGWATCYAHNSVNRVKQDSRVGAGQVIAEVGDTGRASGPHCHFEVRHNYESIDPMPLLP